MAFWDFEKSTSQKMFRELEDKHDPGFSVIKLHAFVVPVMRDVRPQHDCVSGRNGMNIFTNCSQSPDAANQTKFQLRMIVVNPVKLRAGVVVDHQR